MSGNNKQEVVRRLMDAGIGYEDAVKLREISMTLHRWHELECGSSDGAIERDEETQKVYRIITMRHGRDLRQPYPDKEKGAKDRLMAIMARYPDLAPYIQGDPRGCALYILRPGDIPDGERADACYSRGIAVYK